MHYGNQIRASRKHAADAVAESRREMVGMMRDLERALRSVSATREQTSVTMAGVRASHAAMAAEIERLFRRIDNYYANAADLVKRRDDAARAGLAEQARRYGID